ncbi:MAG: 2-hydroxyacyl-CoA dehydratase family protein [Lachnospiraceae bacterium]|nr:2-hydroxyacyl-CoA dehydratase family protein [Lachnospiraceae bacterium]
MNVVDRYINLAKNEVIEDPEKGWDYLRFGFKANKLKMKLLPKKDLPKGYQKLEHLMMSLIADNLGKESGYVWGNIFAPCEIIQCFGLKTISVECLSCFLAGYHLEDHFIDCAQEHGIAPTLCSYHKVFLGAAQCGAVRYPRYAVTTSMTCGTPSAT